MSVLSAAAACSSLVIRLWLLSMPQAVWATSNPPAMRRSSSVMPKNSSTQRPSRREVARIAVTQREILKAWARRNPDDSSAVIAKNIGACPTGLTIGNIAAMEIPTA